MALAGRNGGEMKTETMTQEEVRTRGIDALNRELGAVGMLRFLQQFDSGKGDYSRQRHRWLDSLTTEDVISSIQAVKKTRNRSSL